MSIWRPVFPSGPPQPQPQQRLTFVVLMLATMVAPAAQQWHKDGLEEVKCPSFLDYVPPCTCEASTDGLDFKCTPADGRRPANFADVSAILSAARFLVKTLSITDLDVNATVLPAKTFANGSVAELSIDGSMLKDLDDHAFEGATLRLQSLLLKNGRLTTVPRAVAKVASLKRLDLRSNLIAEVLAYTFFGASKLSYLDLRDNALTSMAENAFLGLENNLRDLVLRENNFQFFPLSAVKILKKLQSLDLAENLINNITSESFIKLDSIKYMDLSSNRFTRIDRNAFASFPRLQKLSLKSNQVPML
jgi:Leucine-rich repeat (LRR) protein